MAQLMILIPFRWQPTGEFYTKQAYVFSADELAESAALIASGSVHDQQSHDRTPYDVTQQNLYLSLLYEKDFSHMHNPQHRAKPEPRRL